MNRKRLQVLKRALIRYNERRGQLKFDLDTWASVPGHHGDIYAKLRAALDGDSVDGCGTTACAGGLAATVPSFRRDGLRLIRINSLFYPIALAFGEATGGDAAAEFFGLSSIEMSQIFDPEYYPRRQRHDPMAVVRRIDKLLAQDAALDVREAA